MGTESIHNIPEIVISARAPLLGLAWRELWQYRELFWALAWRSILIRYKQTVVGVAWAIVRPVLTMAVFAVIFGKLARLPSHGAPYPLLVFCAVLPWQFFANSLTASSESVVMHAGMITKVYFPRLVIPVAAVISGLIDFLLAAIVFAGMLVWYGIIPGPQIIWLPAFLLLAFSAALGGGLWLAALNVRFRDVRHIVPFLTQFGLYISPVGFSSTIVPERWRFLYALNPMVGVIDGFRWCIFGQDLTMHWGAFWISVVITVIMLVSGLIFFTKIERTFADVI